MTIKELEDQCQELTNKILTACRNVSDYQTGSTAGYAIDKADAKTKAQTLRADFSADLTALITKFNSELA